MTTATIDRAERVRQLQRRRQDQFYVAAERTRAERESARANEESVASDEARSSETTANGWTRAAATAADVGAQVLFGAADFLEGVVDLGIGIVGGIGGIWNEEFRNDAQKLIQFEATREWLENPLEEAGLKESYLNDGAAGEIVGEVARGVGQLLPGLVLTAATGGAVNPAVMQAVNLGTLSASAAGNGMEEAYNDGADYLQGAVYGLGSGAVEGLTEKFFGAGTKKLFGRGMLDSVGGAVADTGLKRVAKNALEEAGEEAVSALVDPALKTVYKGTDALREYGTSDFYGEVGKSALVGGLTSVAYGATVGQAAHIAGKDADIADSLSQVQELEKRRNKLASDGRLTEAVGERLLRAETANLQSIEKTLQSVNERKRAALMQRHGLTEAFTSDGKLRTFDTVGGEEVVASSARADATDGDAVQKTERETGQSPDALRTVVADERATMETKERKRSDAVETVSEVDAIALSADGQTTDVLLSEADVEGTRDTDAHRATPVRVTAELLDNEQAIERLARENVDAAQSLADRIHATAESLRSVKDGDTQRQYRRLQRAERLYRQALSETATPVGAEVPNGGNPGATATKTTTATEGTVEKKRVSDVQRGHTVEQRNTALQTVGKKTVLSKGQRAELARTFSAALDGRVKLPQSADGVYLVALREEASRGTVGKLKNTIAFVTGSAAKPTVLNVVRLNGKTETELARQRKQIYGQNRGKRLLESGSAPQAVPASARADGATVDRTPTSRTDGRAEASSETSRRAVRELQSLKTLRENGNRHTETFYGDKHFAQAMEQLSSVDTNATGNEKTVKSAMKELSVWYHPHNPIFEGHSELYRRDIAERIRTLATRSHPFTDVEWQELLTVKAHVEHFVKTYRTVWRNGERTDAVALSRSYIETAERAERNRSGVVTKVFENQYTEMSVDPVSLAKYADRYEETGFYTETFSDFQRGSVDAAVTSLELTEGFRAFTEEHRGYAKHLEKGKVVYRQQEIPLSVGISLYMTSKRKQAQKGLAEYGCTLEWKKERLRMPPLATDGATLTDADVQRLCAELGDALYRQFDESDRAYIAMMEETFRACGERKADMDRKRFGYTNISDGDYYFPIVRADVFESGDLIGTVTDLDTADRLSINRSLREGASGALLVGASDRIFLDHIDKIALYSGFSLYADKYNRVFDLNVGGKHERARSVKTVTENTKFGREMNAYLQKLKQDIESTARRSSNGSNWHPAQSMRRSYAVYQLGANPKVLLGQLSSFFAAHNLLDTGCIIKGIGIGGTDVDRYCPLAKVRYVENAAALSQTVTDRAARVGDVFMRPIGEVDRFVIERLFGACQVQIEKNGGDKVGTEGNKRAAGELLERVILETQQNALATERSGAMRSKSELLRSFTMFSADSVKVFSRFLDAFGETVTLRSDLKRATLDAASKQSLKKRLGAAERKLLRSVTSLTSGAMFMAWLSVIGSYLRGKDEEREAGEQISDFLTDTVGNMIGGLPILKDVYAFLTEGYEIDTMTVSMANDLLHAVTQASTLLSDVASGKTVTRQKVASTVRRVLYAAGELVGVPVRNLYNYTTGILKRISPETGYRLESVFSASGYRSDLRAALEAGDEKLVATIAGLMLDDSIGTENAEVRAVLQPLVEAGYSVLPRAVGDTVTVAGEERSLTREEKERFRSVYATADEEMTKLVQMSAFRQASSAEQARAIRLLYDTSYTLAVEDLTGEDSERKIVLFAHAMDLSKLALILAVTEQMTADTDRNGHPVNGSKKAKITAYIASLDLSAAEKYLVMGFLGYRNVNGEEQVRSYLSRLSLSTDEQNDLLNCCGYV